MPPKKLTKAEKEKLKKEEVERKAAEEEERRLQEEEERKQREEEERKAQEERDRLQAIEDTRFAEETAALDVWLVHQKGSYEEWKTDEWKEKQWDRYVSCEKLPNPLSESELNTYLQCWEQDVEDNKVVETTFTHIEDALRLCEEIRCIVDDEFVPSVTDNHRQLLAEVLVNTQRILWNKVDEVTCRVLEEGNKYLDSDSNLKLEHKTSKMAFCLWGNLSKNPRLKSFSFNEQDILVEIPKPLQLADVAVRVMWPPYDPLSQQIDKHASGDSERKGPEDATENASTTVGAIVNAQLESNDITNENSVAETDAVENASIAASEKDKESSVVQISSEGEETVAEDTEEARNTPADDRQVGSAADNVCGLEGDEVDTRAFVPATGGLVMIELLRLPPQPKFVNGWTIRQVTDDGILSHSYPVDVNATLGSATWTTFKVSMKLPEGVMINNDTKLARWDHSKKTWRTGGLDDINIDIEAGTVTCMAHQFAPIALMLDRYTNMPYQMWEMKPQAVDHTLFSITGAVVELQFEIKGHQCCLTAASIDDSPALPHLVKKWTTFCVLKQALLSAGVNLFPEPDADNYVSIVKKDEQVEAKVYQQMSLLSCVVGFSWSKWNSEVGEQQFVVQACEHVSQQTSWELYIAGNRSCKLKMKDTDEQFSPDTAENHESHPDIFSTMDKVLSEATKQRLKKTSAQHIECVRQWLVSTKPLTYS